MLYGDMVAFDPNIYFVGQIIQKATICISAELVPNSQLYLQYCRNETDKKINLK